MVEMRKKKVVEMTSVLKLSNDSLVPFPWTVNHSKISWKCYPYLLSPISLLSFFVKATPVKSSSPPSTQTANVKGISPMA